MRKLAACITVVAGVMLVAAATAAPPDFGGKIEKGGKIGINTDDGVTQVEAMAFKGLPTVCNHGVHAISQAKWSFSNVTVGPDHKFLVEGEDNGSEIFLKGTFKNANQKVTGQMKATNKDNTLGKCTSKKRDYVAKLGNPGPDPLPKRGKGQGRAIKRVR